MKSKVANYGYIGDLEEQAKIIVECLGGGDKAIKIILETSSTETALGKINDGTIYAGMGICQFDKKPFYLVRDKSKRFRSKILSELGVDILLVEWEHLRYNSFLSLLYCRLYYLQISKKIPDTIESRAKYYKKWYNSLIGKGTVFHYLFMNKYDVKKYKLEFELDEESMRRVQRDKRYISSM